MKKEDIFENIKCIDEYGNDCWYGHDVSKALGYSQFSRMIPAIEKAREDIAKIGLEPLDHIIDIKEHFINGRGYRVPVK